MPNDTKALYAVAVRWGEEIVLCSHNMCSYNKRITLIAEEEAIECSQNEIDHGNEAYVLRFDVVPLKKKLVKTVSPLYNA